MINFLNSTTFFESLFWGIAILGFVYALVYMIARGWSDGYRVKKYSVVINNYSGDTTEITKVLADYFVKGDK